MKVIATKEIRFPFIGGKVYAAGEEFEVNDAEAAALTLAGLTTAEVEKRKYKRRDMKAEE
jgi:hypothetical protein